jgi:hypothetical protein
MANDPRPALLLFDIRRLVSLLFTNSAVLAQLVLPRLPPSEKRRLSLFGGQNRRDAVLERLPLTTEPLKSSMALAPSLSLEAFMAPVSAAIAHPRLIMVSLLQHLLLLHLVRQGAPLLELHQFRLGLGTDFF